jgi:hypothetical protein
MWKVTNVTLSSCHIKNAKNTKKNQNHKMPKSHIWQATNVTENEQIFMQLWHCDTDIWWTSKGRTKARYGHILVSQRRTLLIHVITRPPFYFINPPFFITHLDWARACEGQMSRMRTDSNLLVNLSIFKPGYVYSKLKIWYLPLLRPLNISRQQNRSNLSH